MIFKLKSVNENIVPDDYNCKRIQLIVSLEIVLLTHMILKLSQRRIYRSEEEVEYCHDDICKRIGEIIAFSSKTVELRDKRLLSVQLHFGFTEKIVIVKDLSTNEAWRARLNCFL